MDVTTASNAESSLLTSLYRTKVTDPYTYQLNTNFPNQSKQVVEVQPQVSPIPTAIHGAEMHMKLPQYGLMAKCAIVSTCQIGADAGTMNPNLLGQRMFSNIELRSHNKVIFSQTPDYCAARTSALGQEANNAYTSAMQPVWDSATPNTPVANTDFQVMTPVYLPFSEKTSNFLDLKFLESLELVVTVNGLDKMGLQSPLTQSSFKLLVWYINLSNETEQAYVSKQYPISQTFTMLSYDSYREVPVTKLSSGILETVEIDLKTNNVVANTTFMVRKKSTDSSNRSFVPIENFQIVATGRSLVDSTARTNIFDTGSFGVSGCSVSQGASDGTSNVVFNGGSQPLTHYWGMSKDSTFQSGAIAFNNLNAPRATIKFQGVNGVNYEVIVVHEYLNLVTVNPSDGSVSRGLST